MTSRDEWIRRQVRTHFPMDKWGSMTEFAKAVVAFVDAEWEAKEQEMVAQFCRDMQLPADAAAHYDASVDRPATTHPTPPPREQGEE